VTGDEWSRFVHAFRRPAAWASVVVLSGSLPPGIPDDAYGQLVRDARHGGARTIVDADGTALARSLSARPEVVKPNGAELVAATGVADTDAAIDAVLGAGAGAVVATFGADGVRARTSEGAWRAWLDRPVGGVNPTGAGDAVAAALAAGLEDGRDWPSMLADAIAWSAAAIAAPLAGDVDASVVQGLRPFVRVEATDAARPRG
jgi:tagatose 6-phosphate kinase